MSLTYYYFPDRKDGFGAQFQTLLYSIIFCEQNKQNFLYKGISGIEHNYDNDPNYINEIDELMNIKNNYATMTSVKSDDVLHELPFNKLINIVDRKIDYYLSTPAFKRYKNIFWQNKIKHDFNNNNKFNVAVHVRRYCMAVDNGCERQTIPIWYFANIMNKIRQKYSNAQFHIYSVGDIEYFNPLLNEDVELHINENISATFIQMVSADAIITSRSSLSHVAGMLSDGEVYYIPFWHPPRKEWIIIQ
jgi:hypothetical protein